MWSYADIANVADIVRHHGAHSPDKKALVEGAFCLTFGELDDASSRLASALRQRGVGEGCVVAFFGKNSIPFFEVLYGAAKAGATLLPLNWRLATAELAEIVQDGQPLVIFHDHDLTPQVEALAQQCKHRFEAIALRPADSVHGGLRACWRAPARRTQAARPTRARPPG